MQRKKIEDQFAKLKTIYRDMLAKARLFTEDSLPDRLTREKTEEVAAHSLDAANEKNSAKKQEKEVVQVLDNKSAGRR